eukprot:gene5845-11164_t
MGKASAAFGRLQERLWNNHHVSIKVKCKVYRAAVLSALLYGAETWTIYRFQVKKLHAFILRHIRQIMNISWRDRMTNVEILKRAGLPSMADMFITQSAEHERTRRDLARAAQNFRRAARARRIFLRAVRRFLCISRAGAGQGNGTTANIKEIFTGRCFDYLEFRYSSGLQGKNCTDLFRIFEKEFNNNTKCSDDFSGMFTDFFQAVDQGPTSKDRALFWSGTMSVAHSISKVSKDYITLEDTFPGYIANDLNFCGEDTVGFNYAQCSCKWDSSQKKVFWQKASTQVLQLIDNCAAMSSVKGNWQQWIDWLVK